MKTLTFLFLLLPLYMFGVIKIIGPSIIWGNWLTYNQFYQSGNQIKISLVNKGCNKALYMQQKSPGMILIGPRMNNLETMVLKRNNLTNFKNYERSGFKQQNSDKIKNDYNDFGSILREK